jgi:hypothetical protein
MVSAMRLDGRQKVGLVATFMTLAAASAFTDSRVSGVLKRDLKHFSSSMLLFSGSYYWNWHMHIVAMPQHGSHTAEVTDAIVIALYSFVKPDIQGREREE